MRQILTLVLATLSLTLGATPQDNAPKTKVSSDPLTEEQVAVYLAVLDSYSNGSNTALNVGDKTETLDLSEDKDCVKGIDLDSGNPAPSVVHRLDGRVTKMKKDIVLVDAELQQKKVEENDPQKLMKRAIDAGKESQRSNSIDRFAGLSRRGFSRSLKSRLTGGINMPF